MNGCATPSTSARKARATCGDRYGRHLYGQSALLARRLVEAGTTCVTINTGYWDHHDDIEKGLEQHLPPLDAAIAAAGRRPGRPRVARRRGDLRARRGRATPLINGHAGRDHWAECLLRTPGRRRFEGWPRGRGERGARGQGDGAACLAPRRTRDAVPGSAGIPLDTHYEDASGRPVSIVGRG